MKRYRAFAAALVLLFAGGISPEATLALAASLVVAGCVLAVRHVARCARRDGWLAEL